MGHLAGTRVVVAGGGLAGLTAARDLVTSGASVLVLEGRDHVGGRVFTVRDGLTDGQHAEAGGAVTLRMVQARDGHEAAAHAPRHDLLRGQQRRPDHVGARLVDATPGRRVAGIEKSLAGARAFGDEVEVATGMERLELLARGGAGFHHAHPPVQPAPRELREKGGVTVGPERMAVAKAITRQALTGHEQNG